ncbi:MAG: hypothetical protein EPN97_05140 [Alphaproteobacteria bacterium]|nr:MAG: hypothetical protein EPN97_05140 [Alphaproteobacteria bacterium]
MDKDQKIKLRKIRKLVKGFSAELVFSSLHHGVFILASPFLTFAAFAAEEIRLQAYIIAGLLFLPFLWFCTWDFVRVAVKRKYATFNAVWMHTLPQDMVAPTEGDNAPDAPSLLSPVNALYRLQLFSLLFAVVMTAAAACLLFLVDIPVWLAFPLAPILWLAALRRAIQKLLAGKTDSDPAFAAIVEEAALQRKKRMFREKLKSAWYVVKDFVFWTWIVGPFWCFFIMMGPGLAPYPLSDAARAFFETPAYQPKDDGFYALSGLEAPLDSKDLIAFGKQSETLLSGILVDPKDYFSEGFDDYKHFNICDGEKPEKIVFPLPPPPPPDPNAPPMPIPQSHLEILPPAPPMPPPGQPCLYLDDWGPIIEANKSILERYENLYRYSDFLAPPGGEASFHGQLMMNLARLESVAIAWRAYSGDPEKAVQDWLRTAQFLGRLTDTQATAIGFAIYKTCYNLHFRYLPYILSRRPELAAKYKAELEAQMLFADPLRYDYKKIWDRDVRMASLLFQKEMDNVVNKNDPDIPDGFQGLFRVVKGFFLKALNVNLFKARLYEATLRVHAALDLKEPAARAAAFDAIDREYDLNMDRMFTHLSDMASMYQSFVVPMLIGGMVKQTQLYDANGLTANKERLRIALIEALAAGVKPEEMEGFLKKGAKTDARLKDVITGEAFFIDKKTGAVCFTLHFSGISDVHCSEPARLIENESQLKK